MPATATLFSQVYDTIWTVLDGDSDLTAFMGHGKKFKFANLSDTATALRPSDCPALILRPAKAGFALPNVKEQRFPFTVEFDLAVTSTDWKYIWEFIARVYGALMGSLYGNLGLSYVRSWEFSDAAVEAGAFGKKGAEWAAWICTFSLTVHVHRDARNDGLFSVD
ncbi:MAG: hypothetical protein GXP25_12830 [Planctomycetes bacterium]|nr:hypothetical protein [Planctomycetota bacterium]